MEVSNSTPYWQNPEYQQNVFKAEDTSVSDGISYAQGLHKQFQQYHQQIDPQS